MSDDLHTRIRQLETTIRHMRITGAVVIAAAAMVVPSFVVLSRISPPRERMRQLTVDGEDGSSVTIEGGHISIEDRRGHVIELRGEDIVMMSGDRSVDLSSAEDEGVTFSDKGAFAQLRMTGDTANLVLSPHGGRFAILEVGPKDPTGLTLHGRSSRASLTLAPNTPSASLDLFGGKKLELVSTPE